MYCVKRKISALSRTTLFKILVYTLQLVVLFEFLDFFRCKADRRMNGRGRIEGSEPKIAGLLRSY